MNVCTHTHAQDCNIKNIKNHTEMNYLMQLSCGLSSSWILREAVARKNSVWLVAEVKSPVVTLHFCP